MTNFSTGAREGVQSLLSVFCFCSFFPVRHPMEEMDFRWKEEEPITIFNKELAEFDVTAVKVDSKNSSYVSG